jgi:geranylgeranyl diphosphate synthase, type I
MPGEEWKDGMASTLLQRLVKRYGASIDREIQRYLSLGQTNPDFVGMMAYQFGYVDERLQPIEESGGKRFRPLLCLLACEGVGGSVEQALTVAAAIEILHNFSLVHDDIEDHDATRRHRPTVWKLWGEAQGINVGDAMFALAGRAILDASTDPVTALDLARHFSGTARALTEGQYLDMVFESRADVRAEEYSAMVANKTGCLIEFSLWSGARIGGAGESMLSAMRCFGAELGKAFQIHDDISGIWASRDRTGKEAGTDLRNGKKTLPVLLAAEHADEPFRSVLSAYVKSETEDVAGVMEALNGTGARTRAEERVRAHLQHARTALEAAHLSDAHMETFLTLAGEVTGQEVPSN